MIFFFGKLEKNMHGNMVIAIPQKISKKMTSGKEYVVMILENNSMEKVITKYRDVSKICVRTS